MKTWHMVLLLAFAMAISCWLSFAFGGYQARFDDWHYDYDVLSYGLNRPEKYDDLGSIPAEFRSSGKNKAYGLKVPGKKWNAFAPAQNQAYGYYK